MKECEVPILRSASGPGDLDHACSRRGAPRPSIRTRSLKEFSARYEH